MGRTIKRTTAGVAMAASLAAPVFAQDAAPQGPADWDLHHDPEHRSTMAYTVFSNGLGIGFRCLDGSFGVVVSGLPASREKRRVLGFRFGDDETQDSGWTSTTDSTVVVGDYPAPLARSFREGGELRLTVPGGAPDGRNLQYAVELPPSGAAIDQVLTTCGKPLVDPRDAELDLITDTGLPVGLGWGRAPRPTYPRSRYAEGFVVTSCLTSPDGSLRECQIEMEHPQDGDFGEATLASTRRARVSNVSEPGQPVPVVRVGFRTIYQMR